MSKTLHGARLVDASVPEGALADDVRTKLTWVPITADEVVPEAAGIAGLGLREAIIWLANRSAGTTPPAEGFEITDVIVGAAEGFEIIGVGVGDKS